MGFACYAPRTRRVRILEAEGRKFKVVSRLKTRKATPFGWVVTVGDREYFNGDVCLSREEAEWKALARFIGEEAQVALQEAQEAAQVPEEPSAEEMAWRAQRDAREAARVARRGT